MMLVIRVILSQRMTFQTGKSETDSADDNAGGIPRVVSSGHGHGRGCGGDRPRPDSSPGWTRATAGFSECQFTSN